VIIIDPTKSYEPDRFDSIATWSLSLIDVENVITPIESGTGAPLRAVTFHIPKDSRGGIMFIRLLLTDSFGAVGLAMEAIRFNTCEPVKTQFVPYDASTLGKDTNIGAQLDVVIRDRNGRVQTGGLVGRAPLTVDFLERSYTSGTALLTEHELQDVNPGPTPLVDPIPLNIKEPNLIRRRVTFENPTTLPVPVTFRLLVRDAKGEVGQHYVTIIVLPETTPALELEVSKNATDPKSIDIRPTAIPPDPTNPTWMIVTAGLPTDVARSFDAGTTLGAVTAVAPRPAGAVKTAKFNFGYGDPNVNKQFTLCTQLDLPVLDIRDANQPPKIIGAPTAIQIRGAATVAIGFEDPDPSPISDVDAQLAGVPVGTLAGITEIIVDGVAHSPLDYGVSWGTPKFTANIEVPQSFGAGENPHQMEIIVNDAWGGTARTSLSVYEDAAVQTIDDYAIAFSRAPAALSRGGTIVETITLTGRTPSKHPSLLVIDVPADAALVGAATRMPPSGRPANALVGASQLRPNAWSCTKYTNANTRLVCSVPTLATTMPLLDLTLTTTTSKPRLLIKAGAMQPNPLSIDALLPSVRDAPTETLRINNQDTIRVTGVRANAGPDKTVNDLTEQLDPATGDLRQVPTVVILDGSQSLSDGNSLTFSWVQVSGPIVTWLPPATGNAATSATPQFVTPALRTIGTVVIELSVTDNGITSRDRVTITITPQPDRAPIVSALTATPDPNATPPTQGSGISILATATDPDGDPLTYAWSAWTGDGPKGSGAAMAIPASARQAQIVWPAQRQVTVEVIVSDGRGETTARQQVLGTPLPPLQLSISGTVGGTSIVSPGPPPEAAPNAAVVLSATTNRAPSGTIVWTLVSGPAPRGITFPITGATLAFAVPAASGSGQSVVIRATANDSTGAVTAEQTINLAPTPPPSVSITVWPGNGLPPTPGTGLLDSLQPVLVPRGGIVSANATANGTGTLTYQWNTSPATTMTTPTATSTSFTAPNTDVFLTVTITVTDANGISATAGRIVQVGAGFPTTTLNCGNPVINEIIRQASANASVAVAAQQEVSVVLGDPARPIGSISLGKLVFAGNCSTPPSLTYSGAHFTLFGGAVSITDGTGSVSPTQICLTSGTIILPAELGLGTTDAATPGSPLCISTDPTTWVTPDLTVPDPPAPDPTKPPRAGPDPVAPPEDRFRLPSFPCPSGLAPITGSINWPDVFPAIALAGAKRTTVRFNCGFLEITATAAAPWGDLGMRGIIKRDGSFEASVTTSGLRLFGSTSNTELTGKVRRSATGVVAWEVRSSISNPATGVAALDVTSIEIGLKPTGVAVTGAGVIHPGGTAPNLGVTLSGTLTGQDEFSLAATGTLLSPWTAAPGLVFGSSSSLAATIKRAAGLTKFDLFLTLNGDWPIVDPSLTLRQVTAQLSNHDAPTQCVAQAGDLWLQVGGTAHIDIGGGAPVIDLTATVCVGLTQPRIFINTAANLNSWRPIPNQDFTFSSVSFSASNVGPIWTFELSGQANYAGLPLAGRVQLITGSGTTPSIVVDVGGDLTALNIPLLTTGHVVFPSANVNGYVPVPIGGVTAAPINLLANSVTVFADIELDENTRTSLRKILNPLPIPDSIRFSAQLSATSVRLKGALTFPVGQGPILFTTCPARETNPNAVCNVSSATTTSLQLRSLFIGIDSTGSFGFGGEADMGFAAGDGLIKPPLLPVVAEASIDASSFTVSLYTAGDWPNAMGIQGLTLGNLAISVGVIFSSPTPVPTVGIGATVVRLPDNLASMLGIQSPQEPMAFVANIDVHAPVLQIGLGTHDGHIFLKPVQPISAANADALMIDDANLIFAPLGGDVGAYHYDPGISLSFGGTLLGLSVSGAARVTLNPPNIHADLDVGDIPIGTGTNATTIHATHMLFDVSLTGVRVEADGGIDIAGGPQANLLLDVNADISAAPPTASAVFALDLTNWTIPNIDTRLTRLHVGGAITGSLGTLPSGSFVANGSVRRGSTVATLAGTIALTNGKLNSANLVGSVEKMDIFGVTFSGPGCPAVRLNTVVVSPATTSGVCLGAGFDPNQRPPLSVSFAGTTDVPGLVPVEVRGSFGPTGLHGTGTLKSADLGNPSLTGDVWFGSGLAGVTALDDTGQSVPVVPGDFRFAGTISPSGALNGSSLAASIGSVGKHAWTMGDGTLALNGRPLTTAHVDISSTGVEARGNFALQNPVAGGASIPIALDGKLTYATATTQLGYSLTASMGTQSVSADPARRALTGASLTLERPPATGSATTFRLTGNIAVSGISGSYSGAVSNNGAFCLSSTDLNVDALNASGSAWIGNSGACVVGARSAGFNFDVTTAAVSAGPITNSIERSGFRFIGRISTASSSISATATDVRRTMYIGTHPYIPIVDETQVQDWVSYRTTATGSLNWSNTNGFTLPIEFAATTRARWTVRRAPNAEPNPTGALYVTNFALDLNVSTAGAQLCATFPDPPRTKVCI
jgi:hypothetical protein